MKTLFLIGQIVLFVALFLDLIFWAMAYGSGHKVPSHTSWLFAITSLILIVLICLMTLLIRKIRKKDRNEAKP